MARLKKPGISGLMILSHWDTPCQVADPGNCDPGNCPDPGNCSFAAEAFSPVSHNYAFLRSNTIKTAAIAHKTIPPSAARTTGRKAVPPALQAKRWFFSRGTSAPAWREQHRHQDQRKKAGQNTSHFPPHPLLHSQIPLQRVSSPFFSFAAVSVFCISMAIVIGPTPPGTGVM